MKILQEGIDFEIVQKKEINEYFVWKCTECDCKNETNAYSISYLDRTLFCNGCKKSFKYQWK